jgi:hypothetical protein
MVRTGHTPASALHSRPAVLDRYWEHRVCPLLLLRSRLIRDIPYARHRYRYIQVQPTCRWRRNRERRLARPLRHPRNRPADLDLYRAFYALDVGAVPTRLSEEG